MARPDLITTRRVRQKLGDKSVPWLKKAQKEQGFPLPIVKGCGRGSDLYDESEVDAWRDAWVERNKTTVRPDHSDNLVKRTAAPARSASA